MNVQDGCGTISVTARKREFVICGLQTQEMRGNLYEKADICALHLILY